MATKTFFRRNAVKIIVLAVLAGGGAYGYRSYQAGKAEEARVRYVLGTAEKGTVVAGVSGSGQVIVSSQVDVKAKASGEITVLAVKQGQQVKAGTLLASVDARSALKAVRDAESSLASAKLALDKLKKPADAYALLQAENALTAAIQSKKDAEDDLGKAYEDAYTAVADAFLDLPTVVTGLQDVLYATTASAGMQSNIDYYRDQTFKYDARASLFRDDAAAAFRAAQDAYDANFAAYKASSRVGGRAATEALLDETYETVRKTSEAVKSASNMIQLYQDVMTEHGLKVGSVATANMVTLDGYTAKMNSRLASTLSARRSIQSDKDAIVSAERAIGERSASLAKLKEDPDPLDIRTQELAITQRQDALTDAREKLADYRVTAPFDGIIADVPVKKGDQASSGGTVATIITTQRMAEITLNEVDAAAVKPGLKVTLSFDAVPDLGITGELAEVDTLGAISQGVVSYGAKVSFDTQDDRVKPGMSVTANIITGVTADVLTVPNAAVKGSGMSRYVEVPDETDKGVRPSAAGTYLTTPPRRQAVTTGAANDEVTEIASGLSEGDVVVTGSISPSSTTNGAAQRSGTGAIRLPGVGGGFR